MTIPIANLYFLLAYAWDYASSIRWKDVGSEPIAVPEDLFGHVLNEGLRNQIRRGLYRGYQSRSTAISTLRGRVNVNNTIKTVSHLRGEIWCDFDDLDFDVLHNQILKATINVLLRSQSLSDKIRSELLDLHRYFSSVSDIQLTGRAFQSIQLHSNIRPYGLLLNICELLYRQMLPAPRGSGYRFAALPEERLAELFEKFVRVFYKREQTRFPEVKYDFIPWQGIEGDEKSLAMLPRLETDVSLIASDLRIIVEVKFYKDAFISDKTGGGRKVRSAHLYQLLAYLSHFARLEDRPVAGVLLYAKSGREETYRYLVHGHRLCVATVDLEGPPGLIRNRLLDLIAEFADQGKSAIPESMYS